MGTAQFKTKNKNITSLIEPPKVSITVQVDIDKPIPLQLTQLTKWSLSEVKNVYQAFQRIGQSPVLDNFLFKKIIPLSKKNSQIMFNMLSRNGKFLSIYELICILVLTSYQTYRKKFQFLSLIFDFEHKGNVNGKQFSLIFFSMLYGYCRLTNQQLPKFDTVERFSLASLFPGEDDYETKSISLRKFIDQYDGNSNISHIFNRFQQNQLKQIKQDPLIYALSEFKKYSNQDSIKIHRILYKIYSKSDYEQVYMIEQNKQLRRQNRRDSCYRNLIQQKNTITYEQYDSPFRIRKSKSMAKINKFPAQSQKLIQLKQTQKMLQQKQKNEQKSQNFKIKKMQSIMSVSNSLSNSISNSRSQSTSKIKMPPLKTSKLIFLNGHTHSKNQIFDTINYFKSFSDNEEKVTIKQFFKKFDKEVFLKKQLSSIFKYLDYGNKGEITMQGFFRSFYPGVSQKDLQILQKWYSQYQQIYEADSLKRNRAKIVVVSDGRVLPIDTLERMRQIFKGIDIGDKGFITFQDLRKAFQHGFTLDEIQNLLKQYGDGQKIKLNGLCKMLLPMGWVIQGIDLNNTQL